MADGKPKKPMQHTHNGVLYDFVFPAEVLDRVKEFDFKPNDILVVGYPKTGTTWIQEITWLVANKADTNAASSTPIMERVPLMELQIPGKSPMLDNLSKRAVPRLMNTHLQYNLLAPAVDRGQPKVIVILRNPKDTLVSYYHFYNTRQGFEKIPDFTTFFNMFKNNELVFGDWFDNVTGWYANQDKDNYLFVKYEDMKADHYGSVEKIAKFLDVDLKPEEIEKIVDHTSLKTMKNKKSAKMGEDAKKVVDESKSAFVRKGVVGDWKNHFSDEQAAIIDEMIEKRLKPLGLSFDC